jgi:nucleotide-binding universal stress UspA family protein
MLDGIQVLPTADAGWIDVPVCESILARPLKFISAVDGSLPSLAGIHYLTEGVMQRNRNSTLEVMHVYDKSKDLPPAMREDHLKGVCEALLTSALPERRYKLLWGPKDGRTAAMHLTDRVSAGDANFAVVGWYGRKGRKKDRSRDTMSSNTEEVIARAGCGVIVMKDEDPQALPIGRPTKFVVSVSLNKASTKAFLDVLRLSAPNDEIYVVYVKCFMERSESDYTTQVREKYSGFFTALKEGGSDVFSKFQDRKCEFHMINKKIRESTSEAVVRFAEDIDADMIAVGTNALRVTRGKSAVGTVSLDICMLWDKNFLVSHWIDVDPRVYDETVRPVSRG